MLLRGVTYEKHASADAPMPGFVPLLRATNIKGEIDFGSLVYVPASCVSDFQYLKPGDSVIAASSGSLSVVGKSATLRTEWNGTFGAFCYAIRPDPDRIAPFYMGYFLQTSEYRAQVSRLAAGVNINNLKRHHLEDLCVPFSPLPEQQRIVKAIDSYFTRLDDTVATLERVRRNLDRYRASVLKAAVEGRLVPTEAELARAEGRSYEPASVLLERILAERRCRWEEAELAKMKARGKALKDDRWKANYAAPGPPNTNSLPELPEGWCWASLAQLFASIADGDHQPPPQRPEGVPFLVIGDVKSGRVAVDSTRFVPQEYYASLDERRKPRKDDLLYTVTGSIGIPVRVVSDDAFCVQRHIAILRPTAFSDVSFLYYTLLSRSVVEQAVRKATGTAQKTVGLESLRSFVVPLAPRGEQSRIAAELDAQFSIEATLTAAVHSGVGRCARLRQSVLRWAFEGGLVDQDSTDEPAARLLERIHAERDSHGDAQQKASGRRKATTKRRPTRRLTD